MVALSTLPPASTGIRHQQPNTLAFIDNRNLGEGSLVIAESRLSWISQSGQSCFSLEYPAISLHAISRDTTMFPHECLYLIIDASISEQNGSVNHETCSDVADHLLSACSLNNQSLPQNGHDAVGDASAENADDANETSSNGSESDAIMEIRFVPNDKSALDIMFQAMADCQSLHPDEEESISEDDEAGDDMNDGDFVSDAVEESFFDEQGQAVLRRINAASLRGADEDEEAMDQAQFEDAVDDQS